MRKGFHKRAEESTACQRLLLILSDTCKASLVERSPQRFVQVPPEFLPQLTFPQALSPSRNRRGQLGTIRDLLGQKEADIFSRYFISKRKLLKRNENRGFFSCRRCHKSWNDISSSFRFPLTARLPSPCPPLRSTLAHCSGSNLQRDGTDAKTPHTNALTHF